MAKYITDIIENMYESIENPASIDSTALDLIIQEFLETPQNGYMTEEFTYFDPDATSDITILIDTTSPTITVLEWKQQYFEKTYNAALIRGRKIGFLDSNSPNYPMTGYESILFNFDTNESLNYTIPKDSTNDVYIEYIYNTAQKIDGMFFQGGEDGAQLYTGDSTSLVILAGYVSYSKNGIDYSYLKNKSGAVTGDVLGVAATNVADAKANPFIFRQNTGFENTELTNVIFEDQAIEAQYWRFHIVDIYPYLVSEGLDSGFTSYTAAMSHLRFQQFKINGKVVVTETLPGNAIVPGGIGGDQIGNGEIEERHLADFAITPAKLDGTVTTIKREDWEDDIAGSSTKTWETFTLPNDDGYSALTMYVWCNANIGASASGNAAFQVKKPNGDWIDIIDYPSLGSALNEIRDIYGEEGRTEGVDSARQFRAYTQNVSVGEATTTKFYIRIMGIFAGNIDTHF